MRDVEKRREALCLYLNSSVLIRALEGPGGFLEECCRRHRCVVSSVHGLEGWRRLEKLLAEARATAKA